MCGKIPVTVIITTLNEEKNLPRCLIAMEEFDEIIVVDSNSVDRTREIAQSFGVRVVNFSWNGIYPKKRQWCLDNLTIKNDRVFFVDADEELTPALCKEIQELNWTSAGYFVKGAYSIDGKVLRFGLKNNKLCLFDRRMIEFPVVDDLDIPGMGEIEGHYQPVLKKGVQQKTGQLKNVLIHHAQENAARHEGYKTWEKGMRLRGDYPLDPVLHRRVLKSIFLNMPAKAEAAFLQSYIVRGGFLDGREGFFHAKQRYSYYKSML